MATTKKPLKGLKPVPKSKPVPKKVVAKKALPVKNVAPPKKVATAPKKAPVKVPDLKKAAAKKIAPPSKMKLVPTPPKPIAKKTNKIVLKVVKSTPKKIAPVKIVGPIASKSAKKEATKMVAKKIEKPVKKASVPEKKTPPIPKIVSVPEKKSVTAPAPKVATPALKAAPKTPAKPAKPVVIPKTSTDKKVDYEPDFLKSVLDSHVYVASTPTMRYSDGELQEFRDLINKKLDAAKKELAYLQGLITRKDEMGGDETDNRYMTMEDGGMSMEREQLSQMASRQITFIDHLEKAIMRIESKTYGVCRVTGKLIDKARLRAVPHATLSMEAKLGIVK